MTGDGLALGHDRHGSVAAVQALCGQRVPVDQLVDGHERQTGSTDVVGERRHAQRHTFLQEAFGLAVERLMLAVLVERQHGEEAWAGPSTWGDVERFWRQRELLAVPAGELLAHGLDDLSRAGDQFQRLGHILAELGQPVAAAGWAGARRGNNDTFAREVIGKRLPDRLPAFDRRNGRRLRRGSLGGEFVFGRVGFEILKLKFELCGQPLGASALAPYCSRRSLGSAA